MQRRHYQKAKRSALSQQMPIKVSQTKITYFQRLTESRRTMTIRISPTEALLGTVSKNNLEEEWDLTRFYAPSTIILCSVVVHKQDEYSTARLTLKRWSNSSPTIVSRSPTPALARFYGNILSAKYMLDWQTHNCNLTGCSSFVISRLHARKQPWMSNFDDKVDVKDQLIH